MPIASINPATGETIKTYPPHSESEIEDKLERASNTFDEYRHTSFDDRAEKMMCAAEILEDKDQKKKLSLIMTAEMGKPINAAVAEVEKCAWVCRYYAANA